MWCNELFFSSIVPNHLIKFYIVLRTEECITTEFAIYSLFNMGSWVMESTRNVYFELNISFEYDFNNNYSFVM